MDRLRKVVHEWTTLVGISTRAYRSGFSEPYRLPCMEAFPHYEPNALRSALIGYLSRVPWGRWPEFCVQPVQQRQKMLEVRSTSFLWRLLTRTHGWYLRYAFQYLTAPLRHEPTFFLMGFPKCGTTFLADMLNALDSVDSPTWLSPLAKETFHYRVDQPIHHFMPIQGFYPIYSAATHFMDASVSYSLDPRAVKLAHEDYPDARILLVVRDQVGATESGINYYTARLWRPDPEVMAQYNRAENYRDYPMEKAEAVIAYAREKPLSIMKTFQEPAIREYLGEDFMFTQRVAPLLYDRWLEAIYEHVNPDQVLVMNFSSLVSQPEQALEQAARFLGIDLPAPDRRPDARKGKQHKSVKVFRLQEPAREAIRKLFRPSNQRLQSLCDVQLDQAD